MTDERLAKCPMCGSGCLTNPVDGRQWCHECYWSESHEHAQAMRWLRLRRRTADGGSVWEIGEESIVFALVPPRRWIIRQPVGSDDWIDRRTARALLIAAEAYAEGGE